MAVMKLACMMVLCMVVSSPFAEAALSCGQVQGALSPCLVYLTSGGPLPVQCCNGVRALNNAARTTPDRQAACGCLKQAANAVRTINLSAAAGLPKKCGVNIPYTISPATDCSKVK